MDIALTQFTLSPMFFGAIPLVIAVVQVAKEMGFPTRYAPALSLVLGLGLVASLGLPFAESVVQGVLVAFAASGIYSQGKTTLQL